MYDQHGIPGLVAGADLSAAANQYKFVTLDSAGAVVLATAGVKAIGVLYNRPRLGAAADVRYGRVKVQADAAIAVMDDLASSADGQAAVATAYTLSNGTSTSVVGSRNMGFALEAAAAAGVIFWALISAGGIKAVIST